MGKRKVRGLWHRVKRERWAYFFILPTLFLISIFLFKPVIESVRLSFYRADLRTQTFIGMQNYRNLVGDRIFWLELKNTLIIVSLLVSLMISFSLLISVTVVNLSLRWQSFYRAAFYLPAVSAGIVTSMVWLWMFNPAYGLLNYMLSLIGLDPIIWLGHPDWARLSIVFVVLSWTIGANIILYLAALMGIPRSIYESAEIDGANFVQKFSRITLPLIMPTTLYILIMTTIGAFQIWEVVYLLTGGGPAYQTMTFVYRIYQLGFLYFRFGEASAHATILLMIIFTISFFQFRYLKKELEF